MTASRLDGMTRYLVDVKQQFADAEGHLGHVDQILDQLVHHQGRPARTGSARDPDGDHEHPRGMTAAGQSGLTVSESNTPNQCAVFATVSRVMCGGTLPICLPALNTQVAPSRACQEPPSAQGAWWM